MSSPSRIPLPTALALSAGSGIVLSLAFPPAEIWPLALVAVAPLLFLLREARPRRGLLLGSVYGLAFFGATLYWILRFGELAWVGVTVLMAASIGLVGLIAPAVARPGHPIRNAAGLAALWTGADWLRSAWPFGGFSWGGLGVSQVDNRLVLPLATVAGVWGVTFVVVFANALLVEAVAGGGGGSRRLGRIALAGLAVSIPVVLPFSEPNGGSLDVAAIQIDVRVPAGISGPEEDLLVAQRNLAQQRSLIGATPRPDLVLWGEGALDPGAAGDPRLLRSVRRSIAAVGAPTAIGAVLVDPDGTEHTSELLFDGNGALAGRYDKVHLVPFGEYVPFRARLHWIEAIEQVPVDRVPGESVHTLQAPGLPPFGTPICFENSFPELPRAFVRDGATFLVVPVNNASYGFTAASDQHLQMSRMRAVETGRWIVDAAVSGVTAFVDTHGAVVDRTGLFQTVILRDRIWTSTARTWYVRLGDWVPWLSVLLVVGLVMAPRRRTQARPAPEPLPALPRTLVILPTYDEAATIETVLLGILAGREGIDVVVVDDSSPDGTGDVVRRVAATEPRVRLRERPAKSGLASAYLDGFHVAIAEGYDLVVEMDSDLSHDPAELPRLLEAATRHDLTIGSRYVPGGAVTNWSRARIALSRVGNTYARFMLGIPARDATSGYRVYRRRLLEALMATRFLSDGYGFQVELVMRTDRLGFDVGEVPITFREREHGHSKISRRIVVEALWLVTRWGVALRFGRGPAIGPTQDERR